MKARRQPPRTIAIRALVFQEGDWLSARCLEYDLATQARTLPRLYESLHRLVLGHIAVRLHKHTIRLSERRAKIVYLRRGQGETADLIELPPLAESVRLTRPVVSRLCAATGIPPVDFGLSE